MVNFKFLPLWCIWLIIFPTLIWFNKRAVTDVPFQRPLDGNKYRVACLCIINPCHFIWFFKNLFSAYEIWSQLFWRDKKSLSVFNEIKFGTNKKPISIWYANPVLLYVIEYFINILPINILPPSESIEYGKFFLLEMTCCFVSEKHFISIGKS